MHEALAYVVFYTGAASGLSGLTQSIGRAHRGTRCLVAAAGLTTSVIIAGMFLES